jgi:peptidoglycan-associated lipoprotein
MSMQSSASSKGSPTRELFVAAALVLGAALFGSACGPKYPNCEEDADCKSGEFCVNNLCQQCRSDADCGKGQTCNGGACEAIAGYCDESTACPAGQECVGNRCQTRSEPTPEAPVSAGPCNLDTIYFGFDSSTLENSARDAIAKNAQCVRDRGMASVKITGFTDPRGTEEYNLALGDRRARAVEQYMNSLGVDKKGLSTASMGEEMSRGEDESGWAQDRRVEFTNK